MSLEMIFYMNFYKLKKWWVYFLGLKGNKLVFQEKRFYHITFCSQEPGPILLAKRMCSSILSSFTIFATEFIWWSLWINADIRSVSRSNWEKIVDVKIKTVIGLNILIGFSKSKNDCIRTYGAKIMVFLC